MEDLRREVRAIKNPALAKAQQKKKQKKITQGLSTDAMRREQILRNQQTAKANAKPTAPVPKKSETIIPTAPSYSAPSAPKVTGIIPTTSNSISSPVSGTVAPTQTAPAPTAPAQPSTQEMIEQMNQARLQQQIASLQAAYERSISGMEANYGQTQNTLGTTKNTYMTNLENALNSSMGSLDSEAAKVQPYYYDARNQAAAQSDVSAMNFAQHMASRGVKGGAGGMPEIYRNSALQGNIGALNQQEAQNMAEIERNRSEIQGSYDLNQANVLNNYASDLSALEKEYLTNKTGATNAFEQDRLSAESGVSAEGLQAFIEQMNADRSFGLQEGQLTGMYDGAPTLQAQQYEFERGIQEGNLTGMYQGSPTLQKQMHEADMTFRNKQLAIDSAYKNGQLSLQRAQQAQAAARFEYEKKQNELDREYQQEQFAYGKEQDALNRQDKLASQSASSQSNAQKTILDTAKGMESIHKMDNLTSTEKYNLARKLGYID